MSGEVRDSDRAVLAWSVVERSVGTVGAYRSPDFDDALINATIRSLGGWERVCGTDPRDFDTHLRREFLRSYEAIARAGIGPEACGPLVGFFERENALRGFERDSGRRIATGLPQRRKGIAGKGQVPRLEFKTP